MKNMANTAKQIHFFRLLLVTLSLHLFFLSPWAKADEVEAIGEKPVVLYGTSWCSHCKNARAYLDSLGIEYTDYDIEASTIAKQKYLALKGKGVPLIFVGSVRIDGFNPKQIEQALHQQGLLPSY